MNFSSRLGDSIKENNITLLTRKLKKEGRVICNLSDSNPTNNGLIYPDVNKIYANSNITKYIPDPHGLLSTRQAVSLMYGGDAKDYFLTASTSEAYSYLFKLLCNPYDSILVPAPGYPLFDSLAGLECVNTLYYHSTYIHNKGWQIDISELEEKIKQDDVKLVVVINPNNPTAAYVSEFEHQKIIELCAKYDKALIADEVFFSYNVDATSTKRFARETGCLIFALDGLSKSMCLPQVKLGWILVSGPESLKQKAIERLEIISDSFLSASTVVMAALPELQKNMSNFEAMVRARLKTNIECARKIFSYPDSPYRVLFCGGGWNMILEYPRFLDEESLVLSLLQECSISVQPGHFFDMERDGFISISLILEPSVFESGLKTIKSFIDKIA